MKYNKIVACDLETTGFVPGRNLILEVGAVAYYPTIDVFEYYSELVDVNTKIKPHITELTGISQKTLIEEGCRDISLVAKTLHDFMFADGRTLVVGHNLFGFDLKFLNIDFQSSHLTPIDSLLCWDTFLHMKSEVSSKALKTFQSTQAHAKTYKVKQKTSLKAACDYYRVKRNGKSHRALSDAEVTLKVFMKQARRSKWTVF